MAGHHPFLLRMYNTVHATLDIRALSFNCFLLSNRGSAAYLTMVYTTVLCLLGQDSDCGPLMVLKKKLSASLRLELSLRPLDLLILLLTSQQSRRMRQRLWPLLHFHLELRHPER